MTDMVIPPEAPKHDCVGDENYGCPACEAEGVPLRTWQVQREPAAPATEALVETATRLGRELGRREAAEEIAAKADGIAADYAESARIQRALSIEKGFAKGESNMRTATAFRNKADGAWAVAHIAREIATEEPTYKPEAHRTRCSHCGFYRPADRGLTHHPKCPHAAHEIASKAP